MPQQKPGRRPFYLGIRYRLTQIPTGIRCGEIASTIPQLRLHALLEGGSPLCRKCVSHAEGQLLAFRVVEELYLDGLAGTAAQSRKKTKKNKTHLFASPRTQSAFA